MKEFRPEDWHFFNMNSPADLQAEYKNGQVKIKEYAPYRDGHMLVSASNFDLIEKIELYIEICKVEAGVAIGLYFGNGGYDNCLSEQSRDKSPKRSPGWRYIPSGRSTAGV